jgi:hypothetical protein
MFVFCTNKSASRRFGERGGSCNASDSSYSSTHNNNSFSSIRRTVDVCLIIVYAINLILVLLRLIRGSETEPQEVEFDGESE